MPDMVIRERWDSNNEMQQSGGTLRMWYLVLFPCILRAFSRFFYDMVTAARCPRTGIVPHSCALVKRAFCSVSWQTGGASLRSAERVEQQRNNQGAAEDSCPFVFARAVPLHYAGGLRNATLQLWCNP